MKSMTLLPPSVPTPIGGVVTFATSTLPAVMPSGTGVLKGFDGVGPGVIDIITIWDEKVAMFSSSTTIGWPSVLVDRLFTGSGVIAALDMLPVVPLPLALASESVY